MGPNALKRRPAAKRLGRIVFLIAAFVLLATVTRPEPVEAPSGPATARLHPARVAGADAGPLRFVEGWRLSSDDMRFGGISALHVDGERVTAVSDAGTLFLFPRPQGEGPTEVAILSLPRGPGSPGRKSNRDVESMWIEAGKAWLGFEVHNMVWRFSLDGWRAEAAAQPEAMAKWSANAGPEALVRLADGRFLIFSEGKDDDSATSEMLLFDGDPAEPGTEAVRMAYRRVPGYRVTDAAMLPDGRVLVLNRRFGWWRGWSAVLTTLEPEALREGAAVEPRLLARLESPVDNMEALAVTREDGRTILWIASDDNFSPLQASLLLKFELVETEAPRPGATR